MDYNLTTQASDNETFPEELRFNDNSLKIVIGYCVLFVVAAVGNLTVFISLFRSRHRKSRISLMIRHLAIADLLVTFIMIPLEVGWRLTVQWIAGNLACKAFLFLRAFGLYLSSNVLVCVSLDRYFAVLHPLRVNDARRRGKVMLACAWGISLLYAVPQSIVFHVDTHPKYTFFKQCVSFGYFTTKSREAAYNLFCVMVIYFVPLLVIIVAYTCIMCEISKKSRESGEETSQSTSGRMRLRRSDISNIERARSRTLRMTVTIVVVFVWCWTPYVVMTLWYMFDRDSASSLPTWLQDAFFGMAVSNSCMNPLVYGSYAMNFRRECCKCFSCFGSEQPQNLTRKSTDGKTLTAGQTAGLTGFLLKYFLSAQKVGSATRSTAVTPRMAVNRSPKLEKNYSNDFHVKKPTTRMMTRPPSFGHISFLSEPMMAQRGYRSSFHSEPCPCAKSEEKNSITYKQKHSSETAIKSDI